MANMKTQNSIFGNLDDLFLLCSIIDLGSLSAAADRLDLPVSTVSRRINALQERVGVSLLQSHKRHLRPTEQGQRLYDLYAPVMWQLDRHLGDLQAGVHTLRGTVRITVPRAFYYDVVRHSLRKLREQYPEVDYQVSINQMPLVVSLENETDILMAFDDLTELEDCVAVPLYRTKLGLYAHQDFFIGKKMPTLPEDLANYPWVANYDVKEVTLYQEARPVSTVRINPRLVVNDIHAVADEVRVGMGIALLPIGKARRHADLQRIMPHLNGKIRQSYMVYRKLRYRSLLIELTAQQLKEDALAWYATHNDWD